MTLSSRLASDVFDAFAWRRPPVRSDGRACWHSCNRVCFFGYYGMDTPGVRRLADVPPRDLTLDLIRAHCIFPEPLTCFKKEALLYYMPAFISLWIEHPTNDETLFDSLIWKFRCNPFILTPIDGWRDQILSEPDDRDLRYLGRGQDWFFIGEYGQRTADLVLSMVPAEREAVASFFDSLTEYAPLYWDDVELECASAMLRGRSTAEVLGGRSARDNAHLLAALDALRIRVPAAADDLAVVERAIQEGTSIDALLKIAT